jgi:hypothetical protein
MRRPKWAILLMAGAAFIIRANAASYSYTIVQYPIPGRPFSIELTVFDTCLYIPVRRFNESVQGRIVHRRSRP